MAKQSAEVVLEGTAAFLHGVGGCVGGAGLFYHGLKRQWGYFGVALFITIFHGISAYEHNKLRKDALDRVVTCENCPNSPALRLIQGGAA